VAIRVVGTVERDERNCGLVAPGLVVLNLRNLYRTSEFVRGADASPRHAVRPALTQLDESGP
jgi:hypothetical protein